MRSQRVSKVSAVCHILALSLLLAVPLLGWAENATNISIADPRPHSREGGPERMGPISGTIMGVDFNKHKVVIYTFSGDAWWVQPTVANPFTDINESGKLETDTHLGHSYAALLVKPSFQPPSTTDRLPEVGADVVKPLEEIEGRDWLQPLIEKTVKAIFEQHERLFQQILGSES